ncbi:MAG: arsenate reductase ArsC [Pseudomonadota bacterium]
MAINIMFLCTGNSCRSIIAEALANRLGRGRVKAYSAGSQPTGQVHPGAIEVLTRHGIELHGAHSQSWEEYADTPIDLVITVCDNAAGESCPVWMGPVPKAHWGVVDPAKVTGSTEEIRAAFEKTYEEMRYRIETLLSHSLDFMSPKQIAEECQKIQEDAV